MQNAIVSAFCICCGIITKEALSKSTRAVSERFFDQSRYRKRRNTLCISRFRYRRVGGKDPLTVADDLIRGSQAKTPSIQTDRGRKIRGTTSNSALSHEKCPHGVQQRLSLYRANPVLPYYRSERPLREVFRRFSPLPCTCRQLSGGNRDAYFFPSLCCLHYPNKQSGICQG